MKVHDIITESEEETELIENPFEHSVLEDPVYHATNAKFSKFIRAAHGIFVAEYEPYTRLHYGGSTLVLYVDVRNPLRDLRAPAVDAAFDGEYDKLSTELKKLQAEGYDAVFMGGDGDSYILIGDVPIVNAKTGERM